ncbi:hypothetical protein B296_00017080 [Ensete ventricosum]|uniref:Uncharacterized protein n=1 Tax=Ensete ventricosum TaxID=4639 RepID=A0A426XDC1_ENSVE|nr:hypothetical protein B296_00017080 [Ensete ventricosum]
MHCVVGWLGLFFHGFFFRFKGFFRCFIVLILRWFNHEDLTLFATMFVALWGLDGSRGGSRPQHGWSGSDPYPSYLMVQLFFIDIRKGNHRHKSVRSSRLYFSSDLRH